MRYQTRISPVGFVFLRYPGRGLAQNTVVVSCDHSCSQVCCVQRDCTRVMVTRSIMIPAVFRDQRRLIECCAHLSMVSVAGTYLETRKYFHHCRWLSNERFFEAMFPTSKGHRIVRHGDNFRATAKTNRPNNGGCRESSQDRIPPCTTLRHFNFCVHYPCGSIST